MVLFGAILGQKSPKNSNIWYILESKIKKKYWILAQKFKVDDLPNFDKIQFLNKNMTFDITVSQEASAGWSTAYAVRPSL